MCGTLTSLSVATRSVRRSEALLARRRAQDSAGDTRTGQSASGRPCRALRWKRAPRDTRLAAGATGDSLWRRANGTGWQAPSLVFSVAREAGVASVERIAQASI